jgi:hypothetical protein
MLPAIPEMFPGVPEMFPGVPEMFPGVPEILPSLPEMLPAKAAEDIDKVKSDAQRIDWKRFILISPGNRNVYWDGTLGRDLLPLNFNSRSSVH